MYALKERYKQEIPKQLAQDFGIKNQHLLPRLEKVVISVGAANMQKKQRLCKI